MDFQLEEYDKIPFNWSDDKQNLTLVYRHLNEFVDINLHLFNCLFTYTSFILFVFILPVSDINGRVPTC